MAVIFWMMNLHPWTMFVEDDSSLQLERCIRVFERAPLHYFIHFCSVFILLVSEDYCLFILVINLSLLLFLLLPAFGYTQKHSYFWLFKISFNWTCIKHRIQFYTMLGQTSLPEERVAWLPLEAVITCYQKIYLMDD